MSRVRAAKWEFFVTRWGAMYDWVSGTVKAAAQEGGGAAAARLRAEEVRGCDRSLSGRVCRLISRCHHAMQQASRINFGSSSYSYS